MSTSAEDTFTKQLVDIDRSPRRQLITADAIARHVNELRTHLAMDATEEVAATLRTDRIQEGLALGWWQRLTFDGTPATTTSDRTRLNVSDPGWLNTLGGALTLEEGFILRPLPKWLYLKPLIPDLSGKSVLEIGCNNGFFSLAFRDAGARHVTGVEVHGPFVEAVRWMARYRGVRNVEFRTGDALLDLTLPKHDIVFMSEVHGHFIDPFFGILRGLNLSNEALVIDGAAYDEAGLKLDLGAGIDPDTRRLTYHAWMMSDGLMLSYLYLCGVEPQRVTRYVAPWGHHIVYVIDTTGVADFRLANDFQPCNTSFINLKFLV